VVTNAALLFVGLALSVVSARALGPAGRGALATAITLSSLIALAGSLGLQHALAFFVARDRELASPGVALAVLAGLVVGIPVSLIGLVAVLAVAGGGVIRSSLIIGMLLIVPSLISENVLGVLRGLQLQRRFNIVRLVTPLATLVLYLAWVGLGRFSAPTAVALQLAAVLLAGFVALTFLSSYVAWKRPSRTWTRGVLRYGIVVNLGAIAYAANRQFSILTLAVVGTVADVGVYSVAAGYGLPVMIVATAVALHALPEVAALRDHEQRRRSALARIRAAWWATAPAVAVGVALAPIVVPFVFGQAFSESVVTAQILVVGTGLLGISHVLSEICRALGQPALPALAEFAAALVSVTALIPVVPRYGVEGAAVVSVAAYGAVCFALTVLVRRRLRSHDPG
jgi:O-antigen/teichoic acid export membrane protein